MEGSGNIFRIADHARKTDEAPLERWFNIGAALDIEGFEIRVRHLSKRTLVKWQTDYQKLVRNPKTGRKEPRIDEEALFRAYAEKVITDWRGLTVAGLRKLMVVDTAAPDDTVVAYSSDNVVALLRYATDFDSEVTGFATSPSNFMEGGPSETEAEEADAEAEDAASGN